MELDKSENVMKEKKKQQLGKGIRALLTSMEDGKQNVNPEEAIRELTAGIAEIPLAWISVNPHQPRKSFDSEALNQLKNSLEVHGIIQPLTLRRLSAEEYQLISGERRYRAAKLAGLQTVPAYIRLADDQTLLEMALVENIQREDLNALEVAFSMNRLIDECNLTHEQLSIRLAKDRSTVTNYLRLLKLPPEIQNAVRDQRISMGHARAIAGVEDLSIQLTVFRDIIQKGLSVRATEALIRSYQNVKPTPAQQSQAESAEMRLIQDRLSGLFGSRVKLQRNANGEGKLVISFRSDKEFNDLLETLEGLDDK